MLLLLLLVLMFIDILLNYLLKLSIFLEFFTNDVIKYVGINKKGSKQTLWHELKSAQRREKDDGATKFLIYKFHGNYKIQARN
mmetsp:Transcript_5679/g.7944  ORF Transcript_5679/g.7944 Transcript_5679/m.7944 type:complete len:83 (-) Transcript_5679:405-653(-)